MFAHSYAAQYSATDEITKLTNLLSIYNMS